MTKTKYYDLQMDDPQDDYENKRKCNGCITGAGVYSGR